MKRRLVLRRILRLIGIGATGVMAPFSERSGNAAIASVHAVFNPSTRGALSASEIDDLVAFAEVLVAGGALTIAEREYIVGHIKARTTRRADYLSLYRAAVTGLQRLAGRNVASLNVPERKELIARHRLAASLIQPGEDLGDRPDAIRAIRTRVVPDLIIGYYASPAGWAAVGYSTFPGRCGDLTRYVGRAT